MSTTGHYTRYINQYPGWSDNCDTMYQGIFPEILQYGDYERYKTNQLGYLQVEHNHGNTWSYCSFDYRPIGYNYWQWIRDPLSYMGPLKTVRKMIYKKKKKKAIQNVLEHAKTFTDEFFINLVYSEMFYNRSYCDYFKWYLHEHEGDLYV